MSDTWGSYNLHVTRLQLQRGQPYVTSVPIVPAPTAGTPSKATYEFGAGRSGHSAQVEGWMYSSDWTGFVSDAQSNASTTLAFNEATADNFSFTAMVDEFSEEPVLGTNRVFFSATFIEVST